MSFLADIQAQPAVLRSLVHTYQERATWQALSRVRSSSAPLILTGMGASFYALYPLWLYLNQQGNLALQIEAAELLYYAPAVVQSAAVLLVVSQSGESIEIRRLLETVQGQVAIASVTTTADNFLAAHSDYGFTTAAGAEVGVASKTYTSSLALLHLWGRHWLGREEDAAPSLLTIADQMETLLQGKIQLEPIWEHLQSTTSLTCIGRGPALATALDAALVFKEAARLSAVGLSGGQFRHGPMEAVSPESGFIIFANGGKTAHLNQKLAVEIASHGGKVVLIGQAIADPEVVSVPLPLVDEYLSPLLEILPMQLLAAQFAEAAGLIPGQFRWGSKVVQTE